MYDEKIVSVAELRTLFYDGESIEIDTPDGYQKITAWWDKDIMPIYSIVLENGLRINCADTHLLQKINGDWVAADDLIAFDSLLTEQGVSRVASISYAGDAPCFDFEVDHPNHRYWSDGFSSHNSGKSYIVSGNVVRNALAAGVAVVLLDSEDAVKRKWATALGVDPDHPYLIRWNKNTINQAAAVIADFMKDYTIEQKDTSREDQPAVLFVIDSLGNLNSEAEIDQFTKGDLKGDKGIKAKALKMLVTNCVRLFAGFQIGLVCTNHTYKSQDMYSPDDIISGGQSQIFASDIVVSMNKYKLKEDDAGNKVTETTGIRSKIKCVKTRYAKPFEEVTVHIPYVTGLDAYSGMFDLCEQKKVIVKDGNRYRYVSDDGTEHKLYRKQMTPEFFDMIMREWRDDKAHPVEIIEEEATDVE